MERRSMERNIIENIEKTLTGDKAAFAEIIEAYLGMVYGVALNITGNYTESEDIAQESFLYAFHKLGDLSDPARFGSWLYSIVRRTAFKMLHQRHGLPMTNMEDLLEEKARHDAETPAEIYARKEIANILWDEVAQLPSKTREAIFLYYVEDYSVKRIADFLGISEGAVKMRLKFGRDKLRENLADKLEIEIKRHKPSEKTRNAIIAALPLATGSSLLSTSPKKLPPTGKGSTGILNNTFNLISREHLLYLKNSWGKLIFIGIMVAVSIIFYLSEKERGNISIKEAPLGQSSFENVDKEKHESASPEKEEMIIPDKKDSQPVFLIKGKMINKETQKPVPGMKLYLSRDTENLGNRATDEKGEFEFLNLPEAWYDLTFEPQESLFSDHYMLPEMERIRINILGQNFTDILIPIHGSTYIAGIVIDDLGKPVSGALVYLIGFQRFKSEFEPIHEITTNPDGRFKFTRLIPGGYFSYRNMIVCDAPGYGKKVSEGVPIPSFKKPVENLVIQLSPGEGGVISGRALNLEGKPLKSIVILAENKSHLIYKKAESTDADGRFIFKNIPPGSIVISDPLKRGRPLDIALKENEKVENMKMILDVPLLEGIISGILVDEEENPVKGAMIYAFPVNQNPVHVSLTGDEGRFEILHMKNSQTVDLRYEWPGKGGRHLTNARNITVSAKDMVIKKAEGMDNTGIRKNDGMRICGRVGSQNTGKPLVHFLIQRCVSGFINENPTKDGKPTAFYTPNGEFEMFMEMQQVRGLKEGPLLLGARVEGYVEKWEQPEKSEEKNLYEVEFLLGDREIEESPKSVNVIVRGKVIDVKGEPVFGVEISATCEEKKTWSGKDGSFSLEFKWNSKFYPGIFAIHPDYAESMMPLPVRNENVKNDLLFENYIIHLNRGGIIAGIVTDRKGQQMADDRVMIEHENRPGPTYETMTNYDGYYRFDRVPPGKYRVSIRIPYEESRVALVEEGEITEINFGFLGSTLYGKISENDRPYSFARLALNNYPELQKDWFSGRSRRDDLNIVITTDQTGFYKFQGLPPGTLYMKIFEGERILASWPVDIPKDGEIEKNYHFLTGSITGKVVESENLNPVGNVEVCLFEKSLLDFATANPYIYDSFSRKVRSDSRGNFEFDKVLEGNYILHVFTPSLGEAFATVDVKAGESIKDIILKFRNLGSISIETIDAETGKNLHLWGKVYFVQGEKQVIPKFSQEPTPITIADINIGDYAVYAVLFDGNEKKFYVSEWQQNIKIESGKEAHVFLRMIKSERIEILVEDSDGNPFRAFRCFITDERGSWGHYVNIHDNLIQVNLPAGRFKLVISKEDKILYQDDIEVTSSPDRNPLEFTVFIPRK